MIPKERMQFSVNSGRTSIGGHRLDKVYIEFVADERDDDQISISSKRTRSPRREPHRDAPWNQSPSNRQEIDLRSERSDRRRDIRQEPNYQTLRENLSRPRREEGRSRDHTPRDEHPRGSMSSKARMEQPRRHEYKPMENKPRPPNYPRPHDDEDDRRSRRG